MTLDKVQNWALVKFGRYSHEYALAVAAIHPTEEFLGHLLRYVERHGEIVELNVPTKYLARLRANPQERIP